MTTPDADTYVRVETWGPETFSSRVDLPHTAMLPIARAVAEDLIMTDLRRFAERKGIDPDAIRRRSRWKEDIGPDYLVITLITPRLEFQVDRLMPKQPQARWSGGPRDGEIVLAANGQIAWDGPLAVIVQGGVARWRDVGEGARRRWAEMTEDEQATFRRETEIESLGLS